MQYKPTKIIFKQLFFSKKGSPIKMLSDTLKLKPTEFMATDVN